ncbi:response regulator [Parabacteroides sp. OttesenSCG-928-J18]|nr:response regulator [Parabacteroides sp. OttesenSCG-928-J18]
MKKSILLVDDKPEIAKIITLYLFEYEVKYVENPLIAIAWLTSGNIPDLIVSDINMPEMTGEDLLIYLKENDMFKSIPVFILSNVDESDTRIRLLEIGAADFILKPFNPEELKIRVSRALN